MDGNYSISPSSRQTETPKFLAPEDRSANAPEAVSSDFNALYAPKLPPPPPRPSTPPEVVTGRRGWRSWMNRATICGLAPTVFTLLIILAVVIVVAAVGGGVGGSMAVRNARSEGLADGRASCPTTTMGATSQTTTTASIPDPSSTADDFGFRPPDDVVLALDCPSLTGDTTNINLHGKTYKFRSECGFDRTSDENINIVATMSYSYEHCLQACASYNGYNSPDRSDKCVNVFFIANLTYLDDHGGNCYLKSDTGERIEVESERRNLVVSSLLEQDAE